MLQQKKEVKSRFSFVRGMFPTLYSKPYWGGELSCKLEGYNITSYGNFSEPNMMEKLLIGGADKVALLFNDARKLRYPMSESYIQERVAVMWLEMFHGDINWSRMFSYFNALDQQTFENSKTLYNVVIKDGEGLSNFNVDNDFKLTDPLGSSLYTYIAASKDFKFLGVEEVDWGMIPEYQPPIYYPSFLHPIVSNLDLDEVLITRTPRGDLLVLDHRGMLAAKRHGRWRLYEWDLLDEFIHEIMHKYSDGESAIPVHSLIQILFDLSFKRHGALLVYDPKDVAIKSLTNACSVVYNDECKGMRRSIAGEICGCHLSEASGLLSKPRVICELASLDGALIFNNKIISAFGAFLRDNSNNGSELGARSTATATAFRLGCLPFKASSDGDVSILIRSPHLKAEEKVSIQLL